MKEAMIAPFTGSVVEEAALYSAPQTLSAAAVS